MIAGTHKPVPSFVSLPETKASFDFLRSATSRLGLPQPLVISDHRVSYDRLASRLQAVAIRTSPAGIGVPILSCGIPANIPIDVGVPLGHALEDSPHLSNL